MQTITAPLSALLVSGLFLGIASAQQAPPPAPPEAPRPPAAAPAAPPDADGPPPPSSARRPRPWLNPAPATAAVIRRGTIKAFNLGPNGETNGFILHDDTTVMLPDESATQLRSFAKEGTRITVTGSSRSAPSGTILLDAQMLQVNGQTMMVPAPAARARRPNRPPTPGVAPPPPPPAPARQLPAPPTQ